MADQDREVARCMDFWQREFNRDEREDRARAAADARLRSRAARVPA
jgi:hypothetical protein